MPRDVQKHGFVHELGIALFLAVSVRAPWTIGPLGVGAMQEAIRARVGAAGRRRRGRKRMGAS